MKKLLVIALLASTNFALNANEGGCGSNMTGFTASASAGITSQTGKLKVNPRYERESEYSANQSDNTGLKGGIFGLNLGYGMSVGSCGYIGTEFYVNINTAKGKLMDTSDDSTYTACYDISVKNKMAFGVKAILGYVANQNTLLYVGLGIERAKLELKSHNTQEDIDGLQRDFKSSKAKFIFVPSIGARVFLTSNFFVGGEVGYAFGKKASISGVHANSDGNLKKDTKIAVKLNEVRATLNVGYKF